MGMTYEDREYESSEEPVKNDPPPARVKRGEICGNLANGLAALEVNQTLSVDARLRPVLNHMILAIEAVTGRRLLLYAGGERLSVLRAE